ncbi:hypothetical protein IMG5_127930 [Ichthyophthirius multifiliis]|uniref:EF-hand domain-containing protein n=1 Tax=Ichthyophthirius multifiliis TaxID=5932 RepID=G0QVZ6_ICHMU|nr:hypothetical protein IMG5_127930 [Ichthyophthirius multifiliis]EGR30612.1 hypothetical protein IMG5_127930 [Ichthyophthirius multifiliis]|eukprot:XP_004032199.1 hypothetical protein IMG5_127930 [Ichthyophthirius multifiliis]
MADEDLLMSKKSFGTLMKIPDLELERLFEFFDQEQSGKIDTFEFLCCLTLLSQSSLKTKCQLLFDQYDFDKNKQITLNEFTVLIKTILTSLNIMVGRRELKIEEAVKIAEHIHKKYYENQEQNISLSEFQSIVSKDEDIIKLLFNCGLISKEDLRLDFGGSKGIPDADSDLEIEINKYQQVQDDTYEKIKQGIEKNQESFQEIQMKKPLKQNEEDNNNKKQWQITIEKLDQLQNETKKDSVQISAYLTNQIPNTQLQLDYVYGFNSSQTRNNIKINTKGEIIYNSASIIIILDQSGKQRFYTQHQGQISSIDISKDILVTGDLFRNPILSVWDSISMETIVNFQGILKNGIICVAISNDQTKVAGISYGNINHVLAIYDIQEEIKIWKNKEKRNFLQKESLITAEKIDFSFVFDMKFTKNDKMLVVSCQNEIIFIDINNGQIVQNRGVWTQDSSPQSCLSIAVTKNVAVTGMFKGNLYVWKQNKLIFDAFKHKGPVTAVFSRQQISEDKQDGIISAGRDNFILIWNWNEKDQFLELITQISINEYELYSKRIVSITEDYCQKTITIGTRASEIIQILDINQNKYKHIMHGHFQGELWGLATHPRQQIFFTVGEDNILACWDLKKKCLINSTKLDYPARCIDYTQNQKYLAIGCLNGNILIADPVSLVVIFTFKDREKAVTCLKFSADSENLIVAHDKNSCEILVYDCRNHFKQISRLRGSGHPVTHIDFAKDSKRKIIQCNTSGGEIIFYDILEENKQGKKGKQITDLKIIKDIKWETHSCIFQFNLKGIWPNSFNGTEIKSSNCSDKYNVVAVGDTFGRIKLLKFPSQNENQPFLKYLGHSSQINKLAFAFDDQFLVSIGGQDKCIMQWKIIQEKEIDNQKFIYKSFKNNENQLQLKENENTNKEDNKAITKQQYVSQVLNSAPSSYQPQDDLKYNQVPQQQLQLQQIKGFSCNYKGNYLINMCKYINNNQYIFNASKIVVVAEKNRNQSFFMNHNEQILSIAINPINKNIIATGQKKTKLSNYTQYQENLQEPHISYNKTSNENITQSIYVWDAQTKKVLAHINDFHINSISYLEFSPDGQYLLSIGEDSSHTLVLYNWTQCSIILNQQIDQQQINALAWKNNNQFIICGSNFIKFWEIIGNNLTCKLFIQNQKLKIQIYIIYAQNGICVSGGLNGQIFVWENDNIIIQELVAHQNQVISLLSFQEENSQRHVLYSGSLDGKIIKWVFKQNKLEQESVILQLQNQFSQEIGIISLSVSDNLNQLLIGSTNSEIYEWEINNSSLKKITEGHFGGELWGCAVHPFKQIFATCGGDKTLRVWDIENQSIINTTHLQEDCRAIDWASKTGSFIVIGDIKGMIRLYNTQNFQEEDFKGFFYFFNIFFYFFKLETKNYKHTINIQIKKLLHWIQDIKISADEKMVTFGVHGINSSIEIFEIQNMKFTQNINSINIQKELSGSIIHLDWSCNSQILAVNTDNFELKYINLHSKNSVPPNQIKEEKWHTWTCIYGWFSKGIFKYRDGKDVDSCIRSYNSKVLVTGDDFGNINLYNYPTCVPKQIHHTYRAHSSKITRVRFTPEDKYLISIGGEDQSIMVWKTVNIQEDITDQKQDLELNSYLEEIGIIQFSENQKAYKYQKKNAKNVDQNYDLSQQKPWMEQIKEPSNYYKDALNQYKAPPIQLQLEYVYGYRSYDCRNNIFYLQSGHILYHAACLAIVLDKENNTQQYFDLHQNYISAICLHPDKIKVATGEQSQKPSIYVWDSFTMQELCHFKGSLSKGISCLQFSPSGEKLVAGSISNDNQIAVFDIQTKSKFGGQLLFTQKSGLNLNIGVQWRNEYEFGIIGNKGLKIWNIYESGLFQYNCQNQNPKILISVCIFKENNYVCGAIDGSIQVYNKKNMIYSENIHSKQIDCLTPKGSILITGSKDQSIAFLDINYAIIIRVDLQTIFIGYLESVCSEIRAISVSNDEMHILIGTIGSEIYEIQLNDEKITKNTKFSNTKLILQSHYCPNKREINEVKGLSIFSTNQDLFITCADDGTIRTWSCSQRKQEKCLKTTNDNNIEFKVNEQQNEISDSSKGTCIYVSPDGNYIAQGFQDGSIKLYDKNFNLQQQTRNAREYISDIKISPDNKLIAAGSYDSQIYIYEIPTLKLVMRPLRKHTGRVTHLDFSQDGNSLHSNCSAYELQHWSLIQHTSINNGGIFFKDEFWHTWTTPLGWPVFFFILFYFKKIIFKELRSNFTYSKTQNDKDSYYLLASGDDKGKVKVFRYPCVKKGSNAVEGKGHSRNVQKVKFLPNDEYLISCGSDGCVFQWKINKIK